MIADVAVVTVEYGNPGDTAALVDSLADLNGASSIDLIVVDNTSPNTPHARSAPMRHDLPFRVQRITTGENLYYWGGASRAISEMRSASRMLPPWIVICNNDIKFANRDFLIELRSLDPDKNLIVAPSIVSEASGREQNPLLETPPGPLKRLKWRVYDLNFHLARAMLGTHAAMGGLASGRRVGIETQPRHRPRSVYAPHGACVILSSNFLDRGGSLDTTVQMFAEELTLAEEARRLGARIDFVPSLRVLHAEHSTTGASLNRRKYELERAARRHYYSLLDRKLGQD